MTRRMPRCDALPPRVRAIADARDRLATTRALARHGVVTAADVDAAAVDLMCKLAILDALTDLDAEGEL